MRKKNGLFNIIPFFVIKDLETEPDLDPVNSRLDLQHCFFQH